MSDTIAESLGLTPLDPIKKEIIVEETLPSTDFEYAREKVKEAIETGSNSLKEMAQIASQSQHPRAFEVLATMLNTIVIANKELLNLTKTKIDIEKETVNNQQNNNTTINGSVFVASTSELQKMISEMKKEKTIEHE
jgi:hypothetical protein